MRAVILWLHVLCGVVWVGVCASFLLAAVALASEPSEAYALALRAAPRITRLCVLLAIVIPLTGIGNLLFVARARGFALPPEFVGILAAKVTLLTAMAFALWRAWRVVTVMREKTVHDADGTAAIGVNMRKLITLYSLIMGAGAAALALGFWLSGA
jgi:hypothetical protein